MSQLGYTTLDVPPALMDVVTHNPFDNADEGAWRAYHELWSKIRWAVGTAYNVPYGKQSPAGEIARRVALKIIETNGLPDGSTVG